MAGCLRAFPPRPARQPNRVMVCKNVPRSFHSSITSPEHHESLHRLPNINTFLASTQLAARIKGNLWNLAP